MYVEGQNSYVIHEPPRLRKKFAALLLLKRDDYFFAHTGAKLSASGV